jgi:hypothetical protein
MLILLLLLLLLFLFFFVVVVLQRICQSYSNLESVGRMSRQENLRVSWGFECKCLRCRLQSRRAHKAQTSAVAVAISVSPGGASADNENTDVAVLERYDHQHVCSCGGVMVPEKFRGDRPGACKCNSFNHGFVSSWREVVSSGADMGMGMGIAVQDDQDRHEGNNNSNSPLHPTVMHSGKLSQESTQNAHSTACGNILNGNNSATATVTQNAAASKDEDEHEDEDVAAKEPFECEFDCGFRGEFGEVCKHEQSCALRKIE